MVVRSPKPWVPSDASSKNSKMKSNSLYSSSHHLLSIHSYELLVSNIHISFEIHLNTVASSNSQHRAVKESLAYGMRHKAWKRGPWPSLVSVDDSESRSMYNNGGTNGSASVTSTSFRTRPYSIELQQVYTHLPAIRLSFLSHNHYHSFACAGNVSYVFPLCWRHQTS